MADIFGLTFEDYEINRLLLHPLYASAHKVDSKIMRAGLPQYGGCRRVFCKGQPIDIGGRRLKVTK